jgi:uncharacterized protein (TIGR03437 family)
MTRASILVFFGLLSHAAGDSVPSRFLNRSLAFEPNRGQAAPSVRFIGRGNSYDYLLNGSGVTVLGATLRFSDANPEPQAFALDPLAERHNYFRGPVSQTNVPTYRRVRYTHMYPGIDCVFYGDQKGLEFDFEVSPGADPDQIRLRWSAAKRVRLAGNGELAIETAAGDLRQRRPTVYQERNGRRIFVDGGYALAADGEIHFSLGRYDRTLPLIIDPVLFALDQSIISIGAMTGDTAGNLYLTGSTPTSVLPTSAGVVQPVYAGGSCIRVSDDMPPVSYPCPEAFVIKLDSTGQIVYATYVGGGGSGTVIAVDSAGDAYVAGTTAEYANNLPITPNAAFPKPGGKFIDGFITKFNPTGSQLIYSTYVPNLPLSGMAIDGQGNAYFAGTLGANLSFPVTAGAFQTSTSNSTYAGVVGKLNAAGSALIYGTYLGGSANLTIDAVGIVVDASGAAYVTGSSDSPSFPTTPDAFQRELPDSVESVYVTKIAPSGASLIYSTFLGSGNVSAIRVDAQGNAIVIGSTGSADFPVTPGAFQSTGPAAAWAPNSGSFLAKLDPAGSALVYSTYIAGASALDVDSAGNAYVVGAASYGFPTTAGAFQACSHGGQTDIIGAEFAPDGKLIGATYLGGSSFDGAIAVLALGSGSIDLAGTTMSPDFPGVVGATNLTFVENLLIDDPNRPSGPCLAFTIQNAATFVEGPIAPGEIVTLRGKGIGPEKPVNGKIGADGSISTELAGVTVLFGAMNSPAPLLYVQSEQINAVVPWGAGMDFTTPTGVQVLYNGNVSTGVTFNLTAPGIFLTDYSTGQAAALNADGTPNSPKNPAKRGSVIAFYGTGGGPTDLPGGDGGIWPSSPLAHLVLPVSVTIGNADAEVLYAGSAPGMVSGIFQINVRLPDSVTGPGNPIVVTIEGISSPPSTAYIVVE